jgi:acetyl esterase
VLRFLRERGREVGGDPTRIAVGGDSAGGNMAAALPLKARDEGVAPPDAALLLCPITDFFVEQYGSFERLAPLGIIYDTAFVGFVRGAYVVHYRNWLHPHVSPARGDLRGYPPTLIVSGTADPMIDDNSVFATKLKAAGNAHVEHFVRERMPHGYYFFPHLLKEGDEAFWAVAAFLQRSLEASPGAPN